MKRLSSREYKVMLGRSRFEHRSAAVEDFMDELRSLASFEGIKSRGQSTNKRQRTITFLDTPDQSLRLNGFVLRCRRDRKHGQNELTLKFRSPDRYLAASIDLPAGKKVDVKLEEDISVPFQPRFSHSATIELGKQHKPRSIKEAAKLFPVLGLLHRDRNTLSPSTKLLPVSNLEIFERVYSGPVLKLPDHAAELAIIVWTLGKKGRALTAEFSFRYKDKKEKFGGRDAREAKRYFEAVQKLDWCELSGLTKTQFAYGTRTISWASGIPSPCPALPCPAPGCRSCPRSVCKT